MSSRRSTATRRLSSVQTALNVHNFSSQAAAFSVRLSSGRLRLASGRDDAIMRHILKQILRRAHPGIQSFIDI